MTRYFNIILLLIASLFFAACTPKLTIKALQPSKIEGQKVNVIFLEQFRNDSVNQTQSLANSIATKIIDNKKVFTLKNDIFGVDAIITGEVLNSSANYNVYYNEEIDYSRCRYYSYDEKTRKRTCLEYYIKYIPCEAKEYNVTTAITLLRPSSNQIAFSKTYDKSARENVCYDNYFSSYPFMPSHLNSQQDSHMANSQIASQIAQEIINDISPSYIFFNIEIIDELENNPIYTKDHKKRFETAVNYLEKRDFEVAKSIFVSLDDELQGQSFEVAYNLALIFEANDSLEIANKLFIEAEKLTSIPKYKSLIYYGIQRTNINLENKIKAKSQIP